MSEPHPRIAMFIHRWAMEGADFTRLERQKRQVKWFNGSTQEDVAKQLRTALVDRDNGKNLDAERRAGVRHIRRRLARDGPPHAQAVVVEFLRRQPASLHLAEVLLGVAAGSAEAMAEEGGV